MRRGVRWWALITVLGGSGCSFEPLRLPDGVCVGELTIDSPAANTFIPAAAELTGQCASGAPVSLSGDILALEAVECLDGSWSANVVLRGQDGPKGIRAAQSGPGCTDTRTVVVIKSLCVEGVVNATPYAGTGEADDPFVICTEVQLQAMADNADQLGRDFVLGADVDLTGVTWRPIGDLDAPFAGSFIGRGHIVSGLQVTAVASYAGIFGATQGAEISDLRMANIQLTGEQAVAALVGRAVDTTMSKIVLADSTITGTLKVGGLIGWGTGLTLGRPDATRDIVLTSVTVSGDDAVGGVGGLMDAGTVEGVDANWVEVFAGNDGGGAFGAVDATDLASIRVSNAFVSCTGLACGGVVGRLAGGGSASSLALMGMCRQPACVSGFSHVGGLIGHQDGLLAASSVGVTTAANAQGVVGDGTRIGGAVGWLAGGSVERCSSDASVVAPQATKVGGLVGASWGSVFSSGASGGVRGLSLVGGLIGFLGVENTSNAELIASRASGDVVAEEGAGGGLVGAMETDRGIADCYATGAVSVQEAFTRDPGQQPSFGIGGILGVLWRGVVERSLYAGLSVTGDVAAGALIGEPGSTPAIDSFFDADAVVTSIYARPEDTSLTGPEMISVSTFVDKGWDFSEIWFMGGEHPEFIWEQP